MKKHRLTIAFCISLALHSSLLYLLISSNSKGFKKGIGDDPKIKISSFQIAPFDSQSKISPAIPPQPKVTPSKRQNNTNDRKQNLNKNQEPIKQASKPPSPSKTIQDELKEQIPPIPPTPPPIEQSLSYQLANTQTKQDIRKFYGAEFGQLGFEEQEYILNNLALIGKITQGYLRYPPNAGMLSQSGGNVVEFYLHPNGDISDLKIIKQSGFIILDRNSIKTIEIAYKDYPHPKSKTLIRFHINYYLR